MNLSLIQSYQGVWSITTQYAVSQLLGSEPLSYLSPTVSYNNELYIANYNSGQNPPIGIAPNLSNLWTLMSSSQGPSLGTWTWITGSNSINAYGIYGTLSVPSGINTPGARFLSTSWTDLSNNFWMFGGNGFDSVGNHTNLNDLWKFNHSDITWTWMGGADIQSGNQLGVYGIKGTPDPANIPGGRGEGMTWVDASDNLWMFGGQGADATTGDNWLNDLWMYNTTTNLWTWIGGTNLGDQTGVYGTKGTPNSANIPGGRDQSFTWTDTSGNFWLFGGGGPSSYIPFNDLWQYNPVSGLWVWVSGSNLSNQLGIYGTKGIPSVSNIPGGRQNGANWIDQSGNFWLFGGQGNDSIDTNVYLNDIWKYTPNGLLPGTWEWVNGANTGNQSGIYGTKGVPSVTNTPSSRSLPSSWTDALGNFWLFGGYGYDANGNLGSLNDLWVYDTATNLWTWMGGADLINQTGIYGTKGISSINNIPGNRNGSAAWIDLSGSLWLFSGALGSSTTNLYNDLWKFVPLI